MKLTAAACGLLQNCYITREMADADGIYRVPSPERPSWWAGAEVATITGWCSRTDCPAISGSVLLHRLRLDNPHVDAAGKPEHKYLSPPGARNRIYFPPMRPGDAETSACRSL